MDSKTTASGAADSSGLYRFSSHDIPERDRLAFIREVYGRTIVKHDIEPHAGSAFYWYGTLRKLNGVGLASTACSAVRTERKPDQIDSDDLVLNITMAGRRIVRQFGREAVVGPGEIAVTRSLYVASCDCEAHSRLLNVRVPLAVLAPMIEDLDAILVRTIPATAHVSLLLRYIEALHGVSALDDPELQRIAATHLQDLAALALGGGGEARFAAEQGGARAARRAAILQEISRRSGDPALSAASLGRILGVTARYVHLLLEETGKSFTGHVLQHRLENAAVLLRDPRWRHRKIADIAAEAGFTDLSHFNRRFRRHFGTTPSEVRTRAREDQTTRR